jgi:predicted DNA-binding transcriptional regulator AlpA
MQAEIVSTLPSTGFVRLPAILAHYPVARSTWWQLVKQQKVPQPIKLSANVTAWRAEEIHALIAQKAQTA